MKREQDGFDKVLCQLTGYAKVLLKEPCKMFQLFVGFNITRHLRVERQ